MAMFLLLLGKDFYLTGEWHSADEKVTKCHVRGEEGSACATTANLK